MIFQEQTEEMKKIIYDLESNNINKEKIQDFCFLVNSINIEHYIDFVGTVFLEKLLQSILTCCLNQNLTNWELVDDLLNAVYCVLCKSKKIESDQTTQESSEYIKNILEKVIIELFDNNAYFNSERDEVKIETSDPSDLCEIKITNQIKIVLVKIMSTLIEVINLLQWKMSEKINIILLLMLHKTNELIIDDEHKTRSSPGLSRDTLFIFYHSAVEYFLNTKQARVVFDYLDLILFQKKHLSAEEKLFIVTILLDHLSSLYQQSDIDIMETDIAEMNTTKDTGVTENYQFKTTIDIDSLHLKSFFRQLKEFAIGELINVNQPIRKSSLFVLQSLYYLECKRNFSKNITMENFFHVYETLEESQVHLIFPVIDDIDTCDSVNLRSILLARMFQNDNVTLLREAIKRLHLLNYDPEIIIPLLSIIMKALNTSALFVPELKAVKKSLMMFFGSLNKPYTNVEYYLHLLNAIINVPWGPVPLFFVSQYLQLSSCDLEPIFYFSSKEQCLSKISSLFKITTKLLQLNFKHNLIIRAAIDSCLRKHVSTSLILPLKQANIMLDDMDSVSVFDMFLNSCKSVDREIYKIHLDDLAQSLHFDSNFIDHYLNHNFISENNQIQESSFNMVALFLTSGYLTAEQLLSIITDSFEASCLNIFENIICLNKFAHSYPSPFPLIWCRMESSNPDKGCCFIHSFLAEKYSEEQFKVHLHEIMTNQDHEKYKNDLEFLIKHGKRARQFLKSQLCDPSLDFAKKNYGYFETEYNYLFMFNLFYNSYGSDDYFMKSNNQLCVLFNKDTFFKCENRNSVELKLRMFLRLCQGREGDDILLDLFIFSRLFIDCLSNTNRDVLPVVLEIMEILMFFCLNKHYETRTAEITKLYNKFIKSGYQEVKNSKKTTSYRSNLKSWIFAICPYLNFTEFHNVLMECIDDILEHDESTYLFFKTMCRSICYSNHRSIKYEAFLLHLLSKGLVYGDLPKKDILAEQTVCDLIRQNQIGKLYYVQFHFSCRTRYKCTWVMLYYTGICKNEQWGIQLLKKLMEIFDSKQVRVQYFHNSLTHRAKQRALQNILLLDHVISDSKVKQDLFFWALDNILNYNHQPSIRYFLEWLVIRNLELLDQSGVFWTYFDRAYDERPGSIVSFLSIIFHVVLRMATSSGPCSEAQAALVDTALERITLCSMSQLFNLRLYANVVFIKLYEAFDAGQGAGSWTALSEKYRMVYDAMMRTKKSAKGNAILNAEKLASDFYFTQFQPFEHLSLGTIFHDLPRLADIAPDEWRPWGTILDEPALSIVEEAVQVRNEQGRSLAGVEQPAWIVSSHQEEAPSSSCKLKGPATSSAVSQKKFIPMKGPFTLAESPPTSRAPRSKLIIVTSLIDKTPNIGGLSRSCEVFGATLVVESLEVVRDAEFKALSMTSEKHVNIVEVRRHNLKNYLMEMRRNESYQLIGAEQTTGSVKLQDFKYPEKSILVLGNEKDGIRSDILVLLDSYVEIPQLGVLRSLNVHVTGALFIWEYVKQHCLSVES